MTTQHTHPEQSDGNVPVVEHVPVPDTDTDTAPPPTGIPTPTVAAPTSSSTNEAATPAPLVEEHPASSHISEGPFASALAPEEPVQPFSEFIKEFRQTEARFSSSLPEHHGGTQFMVPRPGITPVEASTTTHPATADVTSTDVEARSTAPADAPIDAPTQEDNTSKNDADPAVPVPVPAPAPVARPVSPLLRPATRQRMPRYTSGRRREEQPPTAVEPASTKPSPGDATPPSPASPETSTSLTPEPVIAEQATPSTPSHETQRPARRYRFDRPSATTTVTPLAPIPAPAPAPTSAPTSLPSAPVVPQIEESNETVGRHAPSLTTHPASHRRVHDMSKPAPSTEQAVPLSQVSSIQEPVAGSNEVTATSAPQTQAQTAPEHDHRRRHVPEKQQRGKGQTATPVTPTASLPAQPAPPVQVFPPVEEVVAVLAEPITAPSEEINPEDLPPLEYAEMQKANSRRRRRRHTNGSPMPVTIPTPVRGRTSVSASVIVPELPAVSPSPITPTVTPPSLPLPVSMPVPMPRPSVPIAPIAPAPAGQQYGITSGYTISQMNQNGESSNAFMGPEPSPARGSIAAQNVRSIRTDVQRTPAYPVRTTEATSASVHQLASVVAQAVQTQTDRMITELRRANQTPTNISVSLPPFPSNERVGVFVDVANLLYSARTLRMNIDFGKLLDFLRGNRRLIRAQAYCPTSPQPGDEQMFLQAVKGLGYRITTKNYKTFSSGAKKADLDLDLCMDVVRLVDGKAVDCIVLVSGDSDFMPMLDYCSDHGVRVEVAAFDEAMSATLRQGCDLFINLSMLEEIRV